MPIDLFRQAFEESSTVTDVINFSFFGEPTLHPAFDEIMRYVSDRREGLAIVINTNLSRMTHAMFESVLAGRIDELRVSVDAATPEIYDRVRPGRGVVDLEGRPTKDRFAAIERKLKAWSRIKDHCRTRHVYTVSSVNLVDLPAYVDRWAPTLTGEDHILAKIVLTYGGLMNDPLVEPHPCTVWDRVSLTIDWTGRMSPCNLDTNMSLSVGRLGEEELATLPSGHAWKLMRERSEEARCAPCDRCVDANNWSQNRLFRKGDRILPREAAAWFGGAVY